LEQLQAVFNWTELALIYHMQAKLKGAAHKWYDNLERYDLYWEQWKAKLEKHFPWFLIGLIWTPRSCERTTPF